VLLSAPREDLRGGMSVIETDVAAVQVSDAGATSRVNNYRILSLLGEGAFSRVYECEDGGGQHFVSVARVVLCRQRIAAGMAKSSLAGTQGAQQVISQAQARVQTRGRQARALQCLSGPLLGSFIDRCEAMLTFGMFDESRRFRRRWPS